MSCVWGPPKGCTILQEGSKMSSDSGYQAIISVAGDSVCSVRNHLHLAARELHVPRNNGSRSGQKSVCTGVSTYTTLWPGYSTVSSKLQSGSAKRSANCLKIGWDVTQSCGLRCTFFSLLWGLGIEHPIRVIQSNMTGLPRIYVWRQRRSDSFCHIPAFKFRSRLFSPPR